MLKSSATASLQRGTSLLEVLVTIVILAFGLLGLAGFQLRAQTTELESYQRAQALVLLNDMASRLNANRANAASYVTAGMGTGDSLVCVDTSDPVIRDQCEWSNSLKGSAEVSGTSKIGAMEGARGCITQVQAPDSSAGVCLPGVYRIDVVWQGLVKTSALNIDCGKDQYGDDSYRRAVSRIVTVGLPGCS